MIQLSSIGCAPTHTIELGGESSSTTRSLPSWSSCPRGLRLNRAPTFFILFCLLTSLTGSARAQKNSPGSGDNAQSVQEILALLGQSMELSQEGKIDAALPIVETALARAQKELSPEHGIVAMCLYQTGFLYFQKSNYEKAEQLYRRALAIAEKNPLTIQPFYLAIILESLGSLYRTKGDYAQAESLYQRALAIRERTQGTEDASYVATLNNQGLLYEEMGDYDRAERLLQRALAVREKLFGPESIFVGESLKNLSSLYKTKGDYDRAALLLERALAIFEKLFGSEDPAVAASLSDLGGVYRAKGDYVRAERHYQRALAIEEKAKGSESTAVAITLDNLGRVYQERGDYDRAESLYKRALAIEEKNLGLEASDVAITLNNLAVLNQEKRNYQEAELLLRRILAMREKALGPEHPDIAVFLDNLAVVYYEKGDFERAEPLTQRALKIREKAFGPNHPDVARTLNNVAALKEKRGETTNAEALYQRVVSIFENAFGLQHPELAIALENLALFYSAAGDASKATAYLTRANDIWEHNIALILAVGSEEQKRLYMSTLTNSTDGTVSLHLTSAPNDMGAARLALTTVLRRKGRALDAMADEIATLRRHLNPEGKELLEQLASARSQLANLVLHGATRTDEAAHKAAVAKLESEVQRFESAVSARSAEFRVQSEVVTIEHVQEFIPPDAALVELISYHPYNSKAKTREERHGAARYAAYVLRTSGDPLWVDLGEAASIDRGVADFRRALKDPQSDNAKQVGRALDERVMRPIRTMLGSTRKLLVSPDGTLNLIPLAALVDEQNRYLIESYAITYLTSGRDLLRMQVHLPSRQPPVVIANPLFDATPANGQVIPVAQQVSARRSADLSGATFGPLPGTAGEAQALGAILPRAKVLTGVNATEGSLKQLSGPDILHIATHGFFLPDQPQAPAAETRGLSIGLARKTGVVPNENPLLRSGIALAGANSRQSREADDGVLTALEAAGLDLWGTKLVVLSACETGVGEIKTGDGVYGLRRALVLAGAESQVMSLWQVSDAATRDLMVAYYRRLESGEGRSEALRQVQLEMLKGTGRSEDGKNRSIQLAKKKMTSEGRSHPFYWASFIPIGDWRSLDQKGGSTRATERGTLPDK